MPPAAEATLAERLEAVERLIHLFRLERMVHLLVTSISLVMLLISAGVLLYRAGPDMMVVLTGLFGSSGLMAYSVGRLLRMWDQALQALQVTQGGKA
jgi:hypothetical protein